MATPGELKGDRAVSALSGKDYRRRELISLEMLRPSLTQRILQDHPTLPHDALVSFDDLARYRTLLVEEMLLADHGELDQLDKEVAQSLAHHATLASNTEDDYEDTRTLGERLSDIIASFGGSWTFIITFFALLMAWILLNLGQAARVFDPYPFILLNLILSCIAAIQAPIIMMSQKRQESKDRLRARNDYQINLKAELEIRHLHEKIDHLTNKQWQRLLEIQQLQLEMLQERKR